MSKVENLQSVAQSARHRWEAAVGTVRSLNLVVALVYQGENMASIYLILWTWASGILKMTKKKRSGTSVMTRDITSRLT